MSHRKKKKKRNKKVKQVKRPLNMKKRVIFIAQSKGGVGKSVYTYNVANLLRKNKQKAFYFDMDNETNTSRDQLQFVNVIPYNLINAETKNLDRSKLNDFLDDLLEKEGEVLAVCDLGATSSEQFLQYLKSKPGKGLMQLYKESIDFEIHCVLMGKNPYPACANYCEELFSAAQGLADLYICKNNYYSFDEVQLKDIEDLKSTHGANEITFSIIEDNATTALETVKQCMSNGNTAYCVAKPSVRFLYNDMLDNMNFPLLKSDNDGK